MKKDKHQRIAYALRRASLAVDRVIRADSAEQKTRLSKWATAWGRIAKLKSA
jgi:hypothetical protein